MGFWEEMVFRVPKRDPTRKKKRRRKKRPVTPKQKLRAKQRARTDPDARAVTIKTNRVFLELVDKHLAELRSQGLVYKSRPEWIRDLMEREIGADDKSAR